MAVGGVIVAVALATPFSASAFRGVVNESQRGHYGQSVYYSSYTRGYVPARSIVNNNGAPTYASKTYYYPVKSRKVIN